MALKKSQLYPSLWQSCDELRGGMDASQYKDYVLTPLLRAHLRLIRHLKADGWRLELVYLALPSVEMAEFRVAERVRHGGHDIPLPGIERRFVRSLDRLFNDYVTLVYRTVCFFNVGPTPQLVFTQEGEHRVVTQPSILQVLEDKRRHGSTR